MLWTCRHPLSQRNLWSQPLLSVGPCCWHPAAGACLLTEAGCSRPPPVVLAGISLGMVQGSNIVNTMTVKSEESESTYLRFWNLKKVHISMIPLFKLLSQLAWWTKL